MDLYEHQGKELFAKTVVSDAGWALTFGKLVPPERVTNAGLQARIDRVGPSLAHISLYVGIEADTASLGLQRSNLWVYESDDHDGVVERYKAESEFRKPSPGMILKLQREWTTDPERSFVVGDRDTDVQAAIAAGVAGYKFEGGNLLRFVQGHVNSGRRALA